MATDNYSSMCSTITISSIGKATSLSLLLATYVFSTDVLAAQPSNFIDDATLNGTVFFWSRDRERKDVTTGRYKQNLKHTTMNIELDFKSGYVNDFFAIELGGYTAFGIGNDGPAHPNEIGFSDARRRWDERYSGDADSASLYKAQLNFKMDRYWAKMGYIQPSGQTLIRPHWSFLPGTYRGIEIGTSYDFGTSGALALSYIWADRYKAPWYASLDELREADGKTKINYLHSIGFSYDFNNSFVVEAAYGQAKSYMHQYFAKASFSLPLFSSPLGLSYQFYGAKDHGGNALNNYDGLAWLQAITMNYAIGPVNLRLEGTAVKAEGRQGYFLQRMTPSYASSNGRLDLWWNSRSDFNANGEKSLFVEAMYDVGQFVPGLKVGTSYAYGWNAKPNSTAVGQGRRIKESAWNLDASYTIQQGIAKGASASLHYTRYNNHSNIPSWGGGYGNMFQDEKDIKFIVTVPFSIL